MEVVHIERVLKMRKFEELTKRLRKLNFTEYQYWIIYHKGNPTTESNANNWIKKVMGNPNLYNIELVEQGSDLYKLSCNNKSKLLLLFGNIDIVDDNVTIKEKDQILFKQIGEFTPDYVLSMTPKTYKGLRKWSDNELSLDKRSDNFINIKAQLEYYDFVMEI